MSESQADKVVEVKLCMGSSCFSRGNNVALERLQEYVGRRGLEDKVTLCGSLCEESCKTGPHIFIDDQHYSHVDPSTVIDILKIHLKDK